MLWPEGLYKTKIYIYFSVKSISQFFFCDNGLLQPKNFFSFEIINDNFLFRFLPYPRFPLPGDPSSYIICVNYQPRIQFCGDYSAFDPQTLTCIYTEAPLPHGGGPAFGPPPF